MTLANKHAKTIVIGSTLIACSLIMVAAAVLLVSRYYELYATWVNTMLVVGGILFIAGFLFIGIGLWQLLLKR